MWLERKQIHKDHWYWYRRWRADGHVRSRYVGRSRADQTADLAVSESGQAREIAMAVGQGPDLAADLGIAMAVNPVDDLAADLGIAMAVNPVTSITTNGVPVGNAAPGREDVSSTATRDRPASKEDAP